MSKNLIVIISLLFPSLVFPQNRNDINVHLKGISLKTDLLTTINNFVKHGPYNYFITGEIYFNDEYSFNADYETEFMNGIGFSRTLKRYGSNIRWYFKQEDCNCSAFFAGIQFSILKLKQTVDQQLLNNAAINFTRSSLEGGVCAGYQTLIAKHFVIDPNIMAGFEIQKKYQSPESKNDRIDLMRQGILLRIMLGVGYRF